MQVAARYTLLGIVGDGAMGTVHKAWDEGERRLVAIKFLHPHLRRQPGAIERFRREAALQATLRHPHVVAVYDFIDGPEVTGLVMEHVDGLALDRVIAKGVPDLPVEWIGTVMVQVLSALGFAHARGLVHRDVKPSNILVKTSGQPVAKIADFGIARMVDGTSLTTTGCTMGTLAFMAPEQFTAPRRVDARSDIYAVGATLYLLLTGQPPFGDDSRCGLIHRILNEPPPWPGEARPDLSPEVAAVAVRAMAKSPADRFQTCEEMAAAVRASTGMRHLPASVGARVARWQASWSRPALLAGGLGVLTFLAVAGASGLWAGRGPTLGSQPIEVSDRRAIGTADGTVDGRYAAQVAPPPVGDAPDVPHQWSEESGQLTVENELQRIVISDPWPTPDAGVGPGLDRPWPVPPTPMPPSADPPASAAPGTRSTVELRAGTMLRARSLRNLTSDQASEGESIHFRLSAPVVVEGEVVVEQGALLQGAVTSVTRGGSVKTQAHITIRFVSLNTTDGAVVSLDAPEVSVYGPQPETPKRLAGNGLLGGLIGGLMGGKQGVMDGAAMGLASTPIVRSVATIEAGEEVIITLSRPIALVVR